MSCLQKHPSQSVAVIQAKLDLPSVQIHVGFEACTNTRKPVKNIWYNKTDEPCCAFGVPNSNQMAIVSQMSSENGCYVIKESKHVITIHGESNSICFEPTISCQFVTQGALTAQAQADPAAQQDARPSQLITHQVLTIADLLKGDYTQKTTFSENHATLECSFKLMCSEEQRLLALSQVENIKRMLQEKGRRVITPSEAANMLELHLQNRILAEKTALQKYMELNGLVNPNSENDVNDPLKFASSSIMNHIAYIDTAQRDVLQRHNASRSNNAGFFYVQLVMAMAPLIVNDTVRLGKQLTPQETKQVVQTKFNKDAQASFAEFVTKVTDNSVTAWTPRYQPDYSHEIVNQNGQMFLSTKSKTAGECQVYSANTFVAQAHCNTLLRNKSPLVVHSYSRISVADDCEGGACSIVNPLLTLQEHDECEIGQNILEACKQIDSKTRAGDLISSYAAHAESFTEMGLRVKECMQKHAVGVASLLAKGVKLTSDVHEGGGKKLEVKGYKKYWTEGMKCQEMGGHATGLIMCENQHKSQLQVQVNGVQVDVTSRGTSQEFCQSARICEGTSHSQQLDDTISHTKTTVKLNPNVALPSQQMPAFLSLCNKYNNRREPTPLIEAMNVNEVVTKLTKFSLSEKSTKVFPCNFYALGQDGFYNTLLLSGDLKFFTNSSSMRYVTQGSSMRYVTQDMCDMTQDSSMRYVTQGADLSGNLSEDEIFTVRSHVSDEEKQLLHEFDETNWPHILPCNVVMQLFDDDGMIPTALSALAETKYNECAIQKVRQSGLNQNLKMQQLLSVHDKRYEVSKACDSTQNVNALFSMRFAVNEAQKQSFEQHASLTLKRKQEVQNGFDQEVAFSQGPFQNMMQVSYSVVK